MPPKKLTFKKRAPERTGYTWKSMRAQFNINAGPQLTFKQRPKPKEPTPPEWKTLKLTFKPKKTQILLTKKITSLPNLTRQEILNEHQDSERREEWRKEAILHWRKPGYVLKRVTVEWSLDYHHENSLFENTYLMFVPPGENEVNRAKIFQMLEQLGEYDQYIHWVKHAAVDYELTDPDPNDNTLNQIKLRLSPYTYNDLPKVPDSPEYQGLCTVLLIIITVYGDDDFKGLTTEKILAQLLKIGIDARKFGVSTDDLILWIRTYYPKTLSLRAFDPLGNLIESYDAGKNSRRCIQYLVNDKHCYPNLDASMKKSASNCDQIKFSEIDPYYTFEDALFVTDETLIGELLKGDQTNATNKIIMLDKTNLSKEAVIATQATKTYTMQFKFDNHGSLTWFIHPTTKVLFIATPNYLAVKQACERLQKVELLEKFVFRGQSLTALSEALFELNNKKQVPKSHISDELHKYLETFYTRAVTYSKVDITDENKHEFTTIDHRESFDFAVERMWTPAPNFTIFDKLKPYDGGRIKCGMYLISSFYIREMFVPSQFLTYSVVTELIKRGYITKGNIKLQQIAKHSTSSKLLKRHLRNVRTLFPRDQDPITKGIGKNMTRHWYGSLGSRYTTQVKGFITSDKVTAQAMALRYIDDKERVYSYSQHGDMFFGRVKSRTPLQYSAYPIYCHILSHALLNLIDIVETHCGPESEVIAVKTDSVVVKNPKKVPQKDDTRYKLEETKPTHRTESTYEPTIHLPEVIKWDWKKVESVYFDHDGVAYEGTYNKQTSKLKLTVKGTKPRKVADLKALMEMCLLCIGRAGTGKSFLIKGLVGPDCLVVSFKNTACANLRADGIEAMTIDTAKSKGLFDKYKRIIVDECFETPLHHMGLLMHLKAQGKIIQLFGDNRQARPVEKREYNIKYIEEYEFAKLVDFNRMDKLYIPEFARANETMLYNQLDTFLNEGKLDKSWEDNNGDVKLTLAYTNERVRRENDLILPGRPGDSEARADWYVGMRVLCNKSVDDVSNCRMYVITAIDGDNLTLQDYHVGDKLEIKGTYNKKNFSRGFCITIHKSQSMTLKDDFRIVQLDLMEERLDLVYTALSRAKNSSQIHLEKGSHKLTFTEKRDEVVEVFGNELDMIGGIYINLNDKSEKVYVGCVGDMTRRDEQIRLKEHLEKPDASHSAEGDWTSTLIGKVLYQNRHEQTLLDVEKKWIRSVQRTHKYEITNDKGKLSEASLQKDYTVKLEPVKFFVLDKWLPVDKPDRKCWDVKPGSKSGYQQKRFFYGKSMTYDEAKQKANEYHRELEQLEADRLYKIRPKPASVCEQCKETSTTFLYGGICKSCKEGNSIQI